MRSRAAEEAEKIKVLRVIQAVLGVFLIAAGILKFLASGVGTAHADFTSYLSVVFSIAEILGGLWMVIGYDPVKTRPWVIAAFVGLWAASAFQAVTGKCSCGCFGNLRVNPWLVTLFDLGAVVVLIKWDSDREGNADLFNSPHRMLKLTSIAIAMIILAGLTQPPLTMAVAVTLGGRPLKNVELEVRREAFVSTVQTDEQGYFTLPPVPPGMYAFTLFGRGSHLDQPVGKPARPALPKPPRTMTPKQKKSYLEAGKRAFEEAAESADAATIWLDLSVCTSDAKVEYK